jgi:hypothetical protein
MSLLHVPQSSLEVEQSKDTEAYYIAAPEHTDKTVIIAHGYAGNATQMSGYARM